MSAIRPFRCFDTRVIVVSLAVAAWLVVSAWVSRVLAADPALRVLVALSQATALAAPVFVLAWAAGVILIARKFE